MKKRFTENQIVAAIKKQEAGVAVKEICRDLASVMRRFTTGRQNRAAWKPAMFLGLKNFKKKMPN